MSKIQINLMSTMIKRCTIEQLKESLDMAASLEDTEAFNLLRRSIRIKQLC